MADSVQRGRGRPIKEAGQVRTLVIQVPVTADEKARIVQAGLLAGHYGSLAAWARAVLLDAAGDLHRPNSE